MNRDSSQSIFISSVIGGFIVVTRFQVAVQILQGTSGQKRESEKDYTLLKEERGEKK